MKTLIVLGALGGLGYYLWKRTQATTTEVPAGQLPDAASAGRFALSDYMGLGTRDWRTA